jgi:hypothetical protein
MNLPFKNQFKDKILSGEKIHTIRKNSSKWTIGKKIHFVTGMRTKNHDCFKQGKCMGLQEFAIYWRGNTVYPVAVFVSGRTLTLDEVEILAKNDGFNTVDDFYRWFNADFKGIIIHWTDYLYHQNQQR